MPEVDIEQPDVGAAACHELAVIEFHDRIEDRPHEWQCAVMHFARNLGHAAEIRGETDLGFRTRLGEAVELVVEQEVPFRPPEQPVDRGIEVQERDQRHKI